jgi:hypothetical protein
MKEKRKEHDQRRINGFRSLFVTIPLLSLCCELLVVLKILADLWDTGTNFESVYMRIVIPSLRFQARHRSYLHKPHLKKQSYVQCPQELVNICKANEVLW